MAVATDVQGADAIQDEDPVLGGSLSAGAAARADGPQDVDNTYISGDDSMNLQSRILRAMW